MKTLKFEHPIAKMLVDVALAQDVTEINNGLMLNA
jgi:hypothetical protein